MNIQKYVFRMVAGGLVLAAVCGFAARAASPSEDAVAFQLNSAHTGNITFASGFPAPLTQLWSFDTGGQVSYPLVAEGKVYVVSNGNDLFALSLLKGAKVWEHLLGGGQNVGTYDNGELFYDNSTGELTALKANSGKQIWSVLLYSDYDSSFPITHNGQVFVAGPALSAVDEATGAVQWTGSIDATDGSAAFGDKGLYVGGPCQYYKYGPAKGTLLWHDSDGCDGGGGTAPVYFQKRVYLVDWAEGNFVLDSDTGVIDGTFTGSVPPTFFTTSKKRGYALEISNGKLYCLDAKTGNIMWSFANSQLVAQPIVINGQPVVATSSGTIYMLNGATGAQIWSGSVGDSVTSLAAGDGVLVVSAGNKVTVFGPQ